MKATSRIALVTASDMTLKAFMLGHLAAWARRFEVTTFANCVDSALLERQGIPVPMVKVGIERKVHLLRDMGALADLFCRFRKGRFDAVFSVTPKAGLLAMLAAYITGVPVRIHIFTGQVWATRRGATRFFLKAFDRLIAALATDVLADSESQRQFLIDEGVVRPEASSVLASGSISGVDTERFRPSETLRKSIRQTLMLDDGAQLLLFLGRLNRDKGVLDLAAAFSDLARDTPCAHLLFVGPDEGGMQSLILSSCGDVSARVHFVSYTDKPEAYMAAADIFCLPSYREGFGSVVIEAAAVGVPAVASRIYGLTDAVSDGVTGILHSPGDVAELGKALKFLLDDEGLRRQFGQAARKRVESDFSGAKVVDALSEYLQKRLS